LTNHDEELLAPRTCSEGSLVSAVRSILDVPLTTDSPQSSTIDVDVTQPDCDVVIVSRPSSRPNTLLESPYSTESCSSSNSNTSHLNVMKLTSADNCDERSSCASRGHRTLVLTKAASEQILTKFSLRPSPPVTNYPPLNLSDDVTDSAP